MKKIIVFIALGLSVTYALLLIPNSDSIQIQTEGNSIPFVWNQDERWNALEEQFIKVKSDSALIINEEVSIRVVELDKIINDLERNSFYPDDECLDYLLNLFFETAPYVAAQKKQEQVFFDLYDRSRRILKKESINWDVNDLDTRVILYKLLFGMRATVEEVLLQSSGEIEPVIFVTDEPSKTPSTELFGIKVHSGDLLISRGGAEVSALISRGNDFPGNFSHVALIYVEEDTNIAYLIEAHIERGVAIAAVDEYMNDGKQRFMVLRPRSNLPELIKDPMLPHKAAKGVFDEVNNRHIPYDFKMDFYDSEKMFCSEVGSYAYKNKGIKLWESESTISSQGVVTLLNTFGVENFVTQMPSDLEYDPKLSVVGEWRDTETLYNDHLYNAVIDAMLECAEMNIEVEVNHFMLPIVRLVKGYSVIKNWMDSEGPIPEGMNATQALKSDEFIQRHSYLKQLTHQAVQQFKEDQNYLPPYWEMFSMAQEKAECIVKPK